MLDICVLFGGQSSEHEVSIISAKYVIENLDRKKYNVHTMMISKDGRWLYEGEEAFISPDARIGGIFCPATGKRIKLDVVFPVLHGKYGEDGTIQGLLELAKIPYVGSGVLSSAVCMDKDITKILCEYKGIPQTKWITIKPDNFYISEYINKEIGYPCFVKPANSGSSVGITRVGAASELGGAIEHAFAFDKKVIIEKAVVGREIECSVMGNANPICAEALGEVVTDALFYDYEAKYNSPDSRTIIPADIEPHVASRIKELALTAYKTCECRGMARVDFFYVESTGEIFLNEINTIPGFTGISMYTKMWNASGVSYSELLDKLIEYSASA